MGGSYREGEEPAGQGVLVFRVREILSLSQNRSCIPYSKQNGAVFDQLPSQEYSGTKREHL